MQARSLRAGKPSSVSLHSPLVPARFCEGLVNGFDCGKATEVKRCDKQLVPENVRFHIIQVDLDSEIGLANVASVEMTQGLSLMTQT